MLLVLLVLLQALLVLLVLVLLLAAEVGSSSTSLRSSVQISGGWRSCSCLSKAATCRKFPLLVSSLHKQIPQRADPSAETPTQLPQKPCPHSSQLPVTN